MNCRVQVRNRRRKFRVNVRLLRWVTQSLLRDLLHRDEAELAIWLVGIREITRLNEQFLQHAGLTDVISFDYSGPEWPGLLKGEIFICLDEARVQSARYRVNWQTELVRYVVHGVLHLSGYDDRRKEDRLRMKSAENRFLKKLSTDFYLPKLGPPMDIQPSRPTSGAERNRSRSSKRLYRNTDLPPTQSQM